MSRDGVGTGAAMLPTLADAESNDGTECVWGWERLENWVCKYPGCLDGDVEEDVEATPDVADVDGLAPGGYCLEGGLRPFEPTMDPNKKEMNGLLEGIIAM